MGDDLVEAGRVLTAAVTRFMQARADLSASWNDTAAHRIGSRYLSPTMDRTDALAQGLRDAADCAAQATKLCGNGERFIQEADSLDDQAHAALDRVRVGCTQAGQQSRSAAEQAAESRAQGDRALQLLGQSAGLQALVEQVEQRVVRERKAAVYQMAAKALATEAVWQVSEGFVTDTMAGMVGVRGSVELPAGAMTGFREGLEQGHTMMVARIGHAVRARRGGG